MRDRRTSTERNLDVKFFVFLAALVAILVLWLVNKYFGVGAEALQWAKAVALGFGVWLLIFFVVGGVGVLLVRMFSHKRDPTDEIKKW